MFNLSVQNIDAAATALTCRPCGLVLCARFVSCQLTFSYSVSVQQQLSSRLDVLTHTQTHIHTLAHTHLTPTGTLHSHVLLSSASYLTGKPEGRRHKYMHRNILYSESQGAALHYIFTCV